MSEDRSTVWGKSSLDLPPYFAAFVNGVAVSFLFTELIHKTCLQFQKKN